MSSVPTYRILLVDDTPSIHEDFRKVLTAAPASGRSTVQGLATSIFGQSAPAAAVAPAFIVDSAMQGREALAMVEQSVAEKLPYAVAFVDMRMPPGWDGLETISHLWAADPDIQIVICTAYSDHSWSTIVSRLGRSHNFLILKKPFDHIEALQLAHALGTKWEVSRRDRAHVAELDRIVAERTEELRDAELRFTEAFNSNPLPQAIIALNPFAILNVNRAFEQQFELPFAQVEHLTPATFGHGTDPARWKVLIDKLAAGESFDDYALLFRPSPQRELHILCSARPITINRRACAIGLFRDITHQIEIEQQLRQSQKLEAIGQLAAGVAHDFNNLLTVIQCYTAELLACHFEPELQSMLIPMQTAASRAASLTRQLLIFSRKEAVRPELINLETVLDELRPLLRRLIGSDIAFEWNISTTLPLVVADSASVEQVIVNLVVNARDAMPDGGTIRIDAVPREIDAATASRHLDAKPGSYVELRVADTGTGIDPGVLPHIFEPFFTTKEEGKGTGLGLSTVYSIVRQHGGWVQVDSLPGKGTTFTFYHPVAQKTDIAVQSRPAPAPVLVRDTDTDIRRILIAEDDPIVRKILASILKRRGYQFDLAADGVAAFQFWQEKGAVYDLVITDIIMPHGMNGLHLFEEIRKTNLSIPVILMSGSSDALTRPTMSSIAGLPAKTLLKPFVPDDLIGAIQEVAPRTLKRSPQAS